MANPHEPLGEDMQQKTPDQLFSAQFHDFVSIVVSVIFVTQIDLVLLNSENTRVAERGFAAVAGQIADYGVGSLKPGFGVDDPVALHQ